MLLAHGYFQVRITDKMYITFLIFVICASLVEANLDNAQGSGFLSRSLCESKYRRHFNKRKARPALLYSFPGAGNTWVRLLIEYATGVYSGSIYNDETLKPLLPAEFVCSLKNSVIKAHPHTHPAADLIANGFQSDHEKCVRGGVMRFERAILLIRDPFDSIWSEYQRRHTLSHVGGIRRQDFNWLRWTANAGDLSHRYNNMWLDHNYYIMNTLLPENVLILRYEDLTNSDSNIRYKTLLEVVKFLEMTPIGRDPSQDLERAQCAFTLAENEHTHRGSSTSHSAITSSDTLAHYVDLMTKTEAYPPAIACRMWNLFGQHASRFGYSSFGSRVSNNNNNNTTSSSGRSRSSSNSSSAEDCTGYAPIDDFKLNPRKEFGSKTNKWLLAANDNTGAIRSHPVLVSPPGSISNTGSGSDSGSDSAGSAVVSHTIVRSVGGVPVRRGRTKSKAVVGRGTNADLLDYRLHDKSYSIKPISQEHGVGIIALHDND